MEITGVCPKCKSGGPFDTASTATRLEERAGDNGNEYMEWGGEGPLHVTTNTVTRTDSALPPNAERVWCVRCGYKGAVKDFTTAPDTL